MKTIKVTAGFTGYPNGRKRHFAYGEEAEVADTYADLIVSKGLASDATPKAAPKPAAAEQKDAE
jgi:hypothetical protein